MAQSKELDLEKDSLRVLLLGSAGAGKSSVGNTLLGCDTFSVAKDDASQRRMKCDMDQEEKEHFLLQVTDTPGFLDRQFDEKNRKREIAKCLALARPGPHVVLMVMRCERSATQKDIEAFNASVAFFGDHIQKFMLVVFVGTDMYADVFEDQQTALQRDLRTLLRPHHEILKRVEDRYCGISNIGPAGDRERQAQLLMNKIQDLHKSNGGDFFSNKLSKEIQHHVDPVEWNRIQAEQISLQHAREQVNADILQDKAEMLSLFDKIFKWDGVSAHWTAIHATPLQSSPLQESGSQ